jgi:ABC-2 type transport system permease protein
MAPWLFMFLISAITMKSLSEEKKTGTIEIITTRPITDLQIILGKYFAGITLVLFTILPTFTEGAAAWKPAVAVIGN